MVEKQVHHAVQHQRMIENDSPEWLARLLNLKKVRTYHELLHSTQHHLLTLATLLV